MFLASVFIITKMESNQDVSSEGECVTKMWHIQTVEYYSALKREKLANHEKTWRNLKCTLLSERGPSQVPQWWRICLSIQKDAGDTGPIPGSRRYPGERNDNLLQCSCLGKPVDRGAWRATVHGVQRAGHDLPAEHACQWKKSIWKAKLTYSVIPTIRHLENAKL